MGDRLQDHRIALVAGDDAVKAAEIVGAIDGNAQFLDLESASVAYHAAGDFGFGMVAGEAVVGVNGWGQVVDFVPGGNRDFKRVNVAG